MITRSWHDLTRCLHDGHTKDKMDTRIQHENEPSQGPSALFWHAKDFATAHEVAAEAWESPPAVIRWLKMSSRMARCLYDQSRIWTFPLSCVHLVSISGQCDACITHKSLRVDLTQCFSIHHSRDCFSSTLWTLFLIMVNQIELFSSFWFYCNFISMWTCPDILRWLRINQMCSY